MKGRRKRKQSGRTSARRSSRRVPVDEEDAPLREKLLRGKSNEGSTPEEASRTELEGELRRGQVVSIRGPEASVEPEGGGAPVPCALRKSTRVPHPNANALVVGDFVNYLVEDPPPYVVTEVLPRRTRLSRIRRGAEHVICANVDLGVIVGSAAEPPFKPRLVDRYLISVREGGLEPVLVLNKIDLVEAEQATAWLRPYQELGLPALAISANRGDGLEELAKILAGRTSVFSGQSGVGKSTLLNELAPDLALRTREVHGRTGKGRHTTSESTLYRFPFGGSVVDTPGVRSFLLHEPSPEALHEFFPEIFSAAESCRFNDCSHRGDEGCAVPAAVEAGEVLPERLESFLALMEEIGRR